MKTFSLTIPYRILSTQQHIDGRQQIRTQTPFGFLDISTKLVAGKQNTPLLDIAVEGDLDAWMIDNKMPPAFESTLFKLASKIALMHRDWPIWRYSQIVVHFNGDIHHYSIVGHLNMAELLPQQPTDIPETIFYRQNHSTNTHHPAYF